MAKPELGDDPARALMKADEVYRAALARGEPASAMPSSLNTLELLLRAYIELGRLWPESPLRAEIGEHIRLEDTKEALSVLESMRNPYEDIDDEVPF